MHELYLRPPTQQAYTTTPSPTQKDENFDPSQGGPYLQELQTLIDNTDLNDLSNQAFIDFTYGLTGSYSYSSLSSLSPDESPFLWDGWLPKSSLVLLEGPAHSGKSRFCSDLAARYSRGFYYSDGQNVRDTDRNIIIISNHHHPRYRNYASLQSSGAALNDIYHLNILPKHQTPPPGIKAPAQAQHSPYGFTLSDLDLDALANQIHLHHTQLVIIDDMETTLDCQPKINDNTLSHILLRLNQIAQHHNTTIIIVRNTRSPNMPRNTLSRIVQSHRFYSHTHVHLHITPDPDDTSAFLLSCSHNTLTIPPATRRFRKIQIPGPHSLTQTILIWDPTPSPWTGQELLNLQCAKPLNPVEQEIMSILAEHYPEPITPQHVHNLTNAPNNNSAERSLRRLVDKGRILKNARGTFQLLHPPTPTINTPQSTNPPTNPFSTLSTHPSHISNQPTNTYTSNLSTNTHISNQSTNTPTFIQLALFPLSPDEPINAPTLIQLTLFPLAPDEPITLTPSTSTPKTLSTLSETQNTLSALSETPHTETTPSPDKIPLTATQQTNLEAKIEELKAHIKTIENHLHIKTNLSTFQIQNLYNRADQLLNDVNSNLPPGVKLSDYGIPPLPKMPNLTPSSSKKKTKPKRKKT